MDKIERARQLFYELEYDEKYSNEFAYRNFEIKLRLSQSKK